MANMASKVTQAFFDSKGLGYEVLGDDGEVIRAGFAMDNREGLRVFMFFDDNNKTVQIKAFDLLKFPADKRELMYKACNAMNRKFRWIKFYVNEDDNTVTSVDDAIIDLDTCGQEVFQCCLQLIGISDEAYPEFMRYIYGGAN